MDNISASQTIRTVSESGSGRTFVVLRERGSYESLSNQIADSLSSNTKVLVLQCEAIRPANWQASSADLLALLRSKGLRQASFVAFGAAGALVQNLCLTELKLVRTLALIDATSRAHPTRYTRIVDAVEKFLPLGLPFRHRDAGFDSKPYVQRIRCPALLVTTSQATEFMRQEADRLEQRLPTSWRFRTEGVDEAATLAAAIIDFQDVPARCPQKNVSRGAAAQSA